MKSWYAIFFLGLILLPRLVASQDGGEVRADPSLDPNPLLKTFLARREAAQRAADLGRSALTGEISLVAGFAHLSGAPLDSIAWLTGRLAELDEASRARARERPATLPEASEEASPEGGLRDALLEAHLAEQERDLVERELLLSLVVHLEAHPELTRTGLAKMRRDLASRLTAAETAFDRAGEELREERAREVILAQRDLARLEELLRGLRRHAVAGIAAPGGEEDVELLRDPSAAPWAAQRLGLLRPFLDEGARAAVAGALARWQESSLEEPTSSSAEPRGAQDDAELTAELQVGLRNELSIAEELVRRLREEIARRTDEINDFDKTVRQRLAENQSRAEDIATRPLLALEWDDRSRDATALYGEYRKLMNDLQAEVGKAQGQKIAAERKLVETNRDESRLRRLAGRWPRASPEETRKLWQAIEERGSAARDLIRLEERHRDETLVLLKEAKNLRRLFEEHVPARTRRDDRRFLFSDLESEVRLIRPNVLALGRYRVDRALELLSNWREWDVLRAFAAGSFWLVVVLAVWWWGRRRSHRAVDLLLGSYKPRSQRFVARDLWSLRHPAERTSVALVDLLAVTLLLPPVRSAFPELGLVLLVYLQFALYRLSMGLASLALATYPEVRPALLTLRPEARALALRTVRLFVLWLLVRQFLRYVALDILAAVTFDEALGMLFDTVLLLGLGFWLFYVWEPILRDALRRLDPVHPLVRFLTHRPLRILRALQGVGHVVLYLFLWIRDVVNRPGGWASILRPLRKRPAAEEDEAPDLPAAVDRELLVRECPEDGYIDRPDVREELDQAFARWRGDRRRGVTLVLGSGGMGKHAFLDHWCRERERTQADDDTGAGRPLRLSLRERWSSEDDPRRWLVEELEIGEGTGDADTLAGRIKARLGVGQIIVVENLQLAFLRRVDGFVALNFFLSVAASASDQLFWVLSMHQPAWRYLSSLGGLVHTEICQRKFVLEPWDDKDLRQLMEERIAAADHEVGFSRLLPRSLRHKDDPLALERMSIEYFRRLAWNSQGNPAVALRLWRETLKPGPSEGRLEVVRFCRESAIPSLRDTDLFLLAAVYTHRSLTEEELVEVTNMGAAQVGAALKNLEAQRLLSSRSKRFRLEPRYLQAVKTDLRRRHFIHGSA